jgi:hypothetical protein
MQGPALNLHILFSIHFKSQNRSPAISMQKTGVHYPASEKNIPHNMPDALSPA